MVIKKELHYWFYILVGIWLILVFSLGLWWMFLLIKIGTHNRELLQSLNIIKNTNQVDWQRMVLWEGGIFFSLLLLVTAALLIFYIKNVQRSKGIGLFLASLTHDLKTPLASIRLQSEVLLEEFSHKLNDPLTRLIEDTQKLEMEMDNILQFSRLKLGGKIHCQKLPLKELLIKFIASHQFIEEISFEIIEEQKNLTYSMLGDELSLFLVLRNFLQNTIRHAKGNNIYFNLRKDRRYVVLEYFDNGQVFRGDLTKLDRGMGLYLCKEIMKRMNGKLLFSLTSRGSLKPILSFLRH